MRVPLFARESVGLVGKRVIWALGVIGACLGMAGPLAAQSADAPAQSVSAPLLSRPLTQHAGLEGRLIWVDGYANLDWLSSRAGIASVVEKMRQAHLNTVVFGAKMFGGRHSIPLRLPRPSPSGRAIRFRLATICSALSSPKRTRAA
ncbi:MAG TPA: hypothetical protein PLH36_16165 [Armatimonadota bacterium]|nr:hypothetical protein [Armatimonadota bacterium]